MRVLVTGGAGYIGSVLCERLLAFGAKVHALDNLYHLQTGPLHLCNDPNFGFTLGDCRDIRVLMPLVAKCDAIVPLAAVVGASACDRDPDAAESTNRAVSLLLSLRSRDQRIVFPATNSGYGTSTEVCTEDTPLNPLSLYAKTKVEAEQEVLAEPNTISLRLATVFGVSPRMRTDLLVNDFVYRLMRKRRLDIYEPGSMRNYVHICDVADCMDYCLDADMSGAYNLGNDAANLSKGNLAALVQTIVGGEIGYMDGSDPDRRNYTVSSKRLAEAGFCATRSLEEGIRELAMAYGMMP